VVWSIGAALDENCRKTYNEFLQRLISAAADIPEQYRLDLKYPFEPQSIHAKLPEKSNLFEMVFDKSKNLFLAWT
jgi:dynein heavy chain, axonemal